MFTSVYKSILKFQDEWSEKPIYSNKMSLFQSSKFNSPLLDWSSIILGSRRFKGNILQVIWLYPVLSSSYQWEFNISDSKFT